MEFREEKEERARQEKAERLKKVMLAGTGVAVGVLLLAGLIALSIFSSKFGLFTEDTYHIKIKYPRNWDVAKGYEGTLVTFVSPKEDPLDTFRENLNISVADLSQKPMPLNEYTQIAIKQMAAVFNNIEVTESKPVTFAGQAAYKYTIRAPQPDDLYLTFIWFIKDNDAYTITYAGQMLRLELYKDKFDEMLRSFSIPTL
jgi:hypothetical protein